LITQVVRENLSQEDGGNGGGTGHDHGATDGAGSTSVGRARNDQYIYINSRAEEKTHVEGAVEEPLGTRLPVPTGLGLPVPTAGVTEVAVGVKVMVDRLVVGTQVVTVMTEVDRPAEETG
jgi:hypothetical protein